MVRFRMILFCNSLVLNMGYYTIKLDSDASKICTIIFPWGKYLYKRLPMGIAGSPVIFQGKISELMESPEYARAYVDDLLCISRNSLENHLEKLDKVLMQLHDVGLNVNAEKPTFCTLELENRGTYSQEIASNLRVIRCRQYLQFNLPNE
jgi:hypothetical protein